MALWSIDNSQSADNVLAESVPSIAPLCKFRNTTALNESSVKVRDLAYNTQYAVSVVYVHAHLYYCIVYQNLAALQTGTCAATVHIWDCYTLQQAS